MTMLLNEYSNLNNLIEEFRKPRESNELSVDEVLVKEIAELRILLQYGWPYQDTYETDDEELSGIPITLGRIILIVCDFCAKHNIDLSDAIELIFQRK